MSLTIYQVDAFSDKPFAGNPAAVCILPETGRCTVDAAGGNGDEPVGNSVFVQAG